MRSLALALLLAVTFVSAAAIAAPNAERLSLSKTTLVIALVDDPDFPRLEDKLVQRAIRAAQQEFRTRFNVEPPRMTVRYRYNIDRFIDLYAQASDPLCRDMFAARYTGGGVDEIAPFEARATRFLRRWDLSALRGFVDDPKVELTTHGDAYRAYVRRYVPSVDALRGLKTPKGTPLVEPKKKTTRSFVAWLCALKRQKYYDVVLTNSFILADLMTEPFPHAVFGKAKVGGVAVSSPSREALDGQVLLASTFGIDTPLKKLSELDGAPATVDERARMLGAYLLAHEIAHAVFGIPDVYDHPKGCLMTSRPGTSYRRGLAELKAYPRPCPRCRPYVESLRLFRSAEAKYYGGDPVGSVADARQAIRILPRPFHGRRNQRLAAMSRLTAKGYEAQGKKRRARRYFELADKLVGKKPAEPTRTATVGKAGR